MSVTDGDRAKGRKYWLDARYGEVEEMEDVIAQVIAAERERVRAPFLALADELSAEADRAALLTSMAAVVATRVNRETAERIRRAAEDS